MIPRRIALVDGIRDLGAASDLVGSASKPVDAASDLDTDGACRPDTCGGGTLAEASQLVLADFADAFAAYTQLGSKANDVEEAPRCYLVNNDTSDDGGADSPAPASLTPDASGLTYDALVVTLAYRGDAPERTAAELDALLCRVAPSFELGFELNAGVYAIGLDMRRNPGSSDSSPGSSDFFSGTRDVSAPRGPRDNEAIESHGGTGTATGYATNTAPDAARICCAHNLRWRGGLLVGDAALVAALVRSPRLGMFRRPVSEAIDRLILAVRTDADAPGDIVQPRVPYPARRWFLRHR